MQINDTLISVDTVPSLSLEIHDRSYESRTSENTFPLFGSPRRWPVTVRPTRITG